MMKQKVFRIVAVMRKSRVALISYVEAGNPQEAFEKWTPIGTYNARRCDIDVNVACKQETIAFNDGYKISVLEIVR